MTPSNVVPGFRSTGVCPFERRAIKVARYEEHDEEEDLSEQTGRKYIPLLSPAPNRERPVRALKFPPTSHSQRRRFSDSRYAGKMVVT